MIRVAPRINIDKHTSVGRRPDGNTTAWVVTAGAGHPANADRYASYRLEITHDFSGDPDRVTRIVWRDGVRYEVVTVEEYDQAVCDIRDHAECEGHPDDGHFDGPAGETHYCDGSCVQPRDILNSQGVIHEDMARAWGFRLDWLDGFERSWDAAQAFLDFGIAGR